MKKLLSLLFMSMSVLLSSCGDDPVEQTTDERTNSEATGDVIATTIGQETGGAGIIAQDASNLAEGFSFGNEAYKKQQVLAIIDSSYDDATKTHIVTVERNRTLGDHSFSSLVTYRYVYHTGPVATAEFTKGVTDKIVIATNGRQQVNTPRINSTDSSAANFILKGIAAGGPPPTLSGEYWRGGTHTPTKALQGKTITVDQTITFTNCSIARADSTISITGTGTASYQATGGPGGTTNRNVKINFNGDGTATLAMTRIKDGTTDSCMVDIKTGRWLKWITTK